MHRVVQIRRFWHDLPYNTNKRLRLRVEDAFPFASNGEEIVQMSWIDGNYFYSVAYCVMKIVIRERRERISYVCRRKIGM